MRRSSGLARRWMRRAAATLPVAVVLLAGATAQARSVPCSAHHGARFCRAVELRKAVKILRAREAEAAARVDLRIGGGRGRLGWEIGKLYPASRWHRARLASLQALSASNVKLARYLAARRGWVGRQWTALRSLWTRETAPSFPSHAPNGQGCDGIPQACPASKMGPGWEDSPTQQIEWGLSYIASVYGSPAEAWARDESRCGGPSGCWY